MKIHVQYIFTKEEREDEELQWLINYLDDKACELMGEIISDSDFWDKIDISSEDKVEE